jgi:exopolysaccharide biosynthesis polyprenyl glycosylphosphotransferase
MRAVVRRSSHYVQNVLVIGADTRTELIAGKLATHPEYRFNVVGSVAVTPNGTETDGSETSSGSVSALDQLPDLVRRLGVERIILASPDRANGRLISTIHSLTDLGLHVDIVPELYHVLGPRSHLRTLDGIRLLSIAPPNVSRSSLAAKRVLDASLGAVLLFLFAPLFAYIAIRLKIDSRGPVVYRQERLGRHGRTFRILKFRTMYSDQCRGPEYGGEKAEEMFRDLLRSSEREQEFEQSYKLRDDPRVTPFGAWLRKTSLDELPQLVNVLLGQMSLVGPRPIVADELARYGEYGGKLLSFRPGMTGHWQINGRSRVPYPERVRLDFAYISNWSLWLDITTLAKTLRALRCGGAV